MARLPSLREVGTRMDPLHPVRRLRGQVNEPDVSWYRVKMPFDLNAINANRERQGIPPIEIDMEAVEADLKTTLREAGGFVGLYHRKDKGLFTVHREAPGQRGSNAGSGSLRDLLERHDTAHKVRMLVYNTWLIDPPAGIGEPPARTERRDEMADVLGASEYDVMTLCEVFDDGDVAILKRAIPLEAQVGPEPAAVGLSSGLVTFARRGWIRDDDRMDFDAEGAFFSLERHAEKGVLYTEIDLGPGRIDLFSTHLHAEDADVRKAQLIELLRFLRAHSKPENVTMVVGDLNIDGRWMEYDRLLRAFARYDLEDLWLSRGGPSGSTHVIDRMEVVCSLDDRGDSGHPYCDDEHVFAGDHTESDDIPGYRLDYVFLEKPKPEHSMVVDVARMRRQPFLRDLAGQPLIGENADPRNFWERREIGSPPNVTPVRWPNYLSDHIGLDLTLYVSPA